MLPVNLSDALDALDGSVLFRREFGDRYIDYFISLKRAELGRYTQATHEIGAHETTNNVTEWEQNEYFDFF